MEAGIRATAPSRPHSPRIALVHDWLTGVRGGEKCLEVLCRAFPESALYTLIHRKGELTPEIEGMDIRTSPLQKVPGIFRHYRKLLPIMPLAARSWRVDDVDLVVSFSHCVAKSIRVPVGATHVSYCFTPMRYAWDGRDAYLESWPERSPKRWLAKALLDRLREWDRRTSATVDHFISISKTVQDRIRQCYGRESVVIQPPVDATYYQPDDRPREDYYLCVSALVPYKRFDQAIEACNRSGRKLVVIGSGPESDRLRRMAGPTIRCLGWQPDEVIRDHYRGCKALLFPGEEDFGIVPIEALACGSPVIALGRGGVAETVDSAVGATYDEATSDALLAAIDGWEAAGCPHDPVEGRRRAEAFDVPQFRARLLGYLQEVTRDKSTSAVPAPHVKIGGRRGALRSERF